MDKWSVNRRQRVGRVSPWPVVWFRFSAFPHQPFGLDFGSYVDSEPIRDEKHLRQDVGQFGPEVCFQLAGRPPLVPRAR